LHSNGFAFKSLMLAHSRHFARLRNPVANPGARRTLANPQQSGWCVP
jgi:hypothetical protein